MRTVSYCIYQSKDFPLPDPNRSRIHDRVYSGAIEMGDDYSMEDALEQVFRVHNQDDRPSADRIRSLSVSDVVSIRPEGCAPSFYEVRAVGFAGVDARAVPHGGQEDPLSALHLLPASNDGVFLRLSLSDPDGGRFADQVNVPMADVIGALVEKGIIPASEGTWTAKLGVHHGGVALVAATTPADETEYPGINVDALDENLADIYLANVELPNGDYPGDITARLYNGYAAFESDEPAVLMHTKIRSHEDATRLGIYADEKSELRKIAYVNRDNCESRTWDGDVSAEHEYEPPADTAGEG